MMIIYRPFEDIFDQTTLVMLELGGVFFSVPLFIFESKMGYQRQLGRNLIQIFSAFQILIAIVGFIKMFYNIVIKRLFKCRQRNAIESINEATKIEEEEEKDHDSSIAASGVRMNFYKINTRSIRPELSIASNKESNKTKDSSMTHSEHKLKKC